MKEQAQRLWDTYPKGADRIDGPHACGLRHGMRQEKKVLSGEGEVWKK